MCGKSLKMHLVSLVLFLLLFFSQSFSSCFADVILTHEEAQEILNEIENSKTELQEAKATYSEQKKYYEMQLQEADKKNNALETGTAVLSTTTIMSVIIIVILLTI